MAKAKAKAKVNTDKITMIKVSDLESNPYRDFDINPMDQNRVDELIPSIKADGLYSPVLVRRNPGPGKPYQVVAMHTRLEASKQLGMKEVPCIILEDCPDSRMIRVMTSENSLQRERPAAVRDSVAAYVKPLVKAVLFSDDYEEYRTQAEKEGFNPDIIQEAGFVQVKASLKAGALPSWKVVKPITTGLTTSQVQNSLAYFRATGLDRKIVAGVLDKLSKDPEFKRRREERIKALGVDPEKIEKEKEKAENAVREAALKKAKLQTVVLDPATPDQEAEKAAEQLKAAENKYKEAEKALKETRQKEVKARNSLDVFISGPALVKQLQGSGEPLVDPAALEGINIEGQVRAILAAFGKDKIGPKRLIPLAEQKNIIQSVIKSAQAAGTKPTAADFTSAIASALKDKREQRREEKEKSLTPEELKKKEQREAIREFKTASQRLVTAMATAAGAINTIQEHFRPERLKKNPGIYGEFAAKYQDNEIDFETFESEIPGFIKQLEALCKSAKKAEIVYTKNLAKVEAELNKADTGVDPVVTD